MAGVQIAPVFFMCVAKSSLYILELLAKNMAQVSEKNIDTVRHVENLDLREKMRILLHLTREQVES